MGWQAAAAVVAAVVSAGSAYYSNQSSIDQQNAAAAYQRDVAAANAVAYRNQADIESQRALVQQQQYELEKEKMGHAFRDVQGENIAALGAAGVEITTGSAMDLLEGNIDLYANDLSVNAYQKQLSAWESRNTQQTLLWQASLQDSQGTYYNNAINNSGASILSAGLTGLGSGLSTYAAFGGGFGSTGKVASAGATGGASSLSRGFQQSGAPKPLF